MSEGNVRITYEYRYSAIVEHRSQPFLSSRMWYVFGMMPSSSPRLLKIRSLCVVYLPRGVGRWVSTGGCDREECTGGVSCDVF
jgi:hypothetical protein